LAAKPLDLHRLLSRGSTSAPEEAPAKSASARWKASEATSPKPAENGGREAFWIGEW